MMILDDFIVNSISKGNQPLSFRHLQLPRSNLRNIIKSTYLKLCGSNVYNILWSVYSHWEDEPTNNNQTGKFVELMAVLYCWIVQAFEKTVDFWWFQTPWRACKVNLIWIEFYAATDCRPHMAWCMTWLVWQNIISDVHHEFHWKFVFSFYCSLTLSALSKSVTPLTLLWLGFYFN